MAHAHLDPRSIGLDTETVQAKGQDRQDAARDAYIARVVAEAPQLSAAQTDLLAGIFAPHVNATPAISTGQYQSWELKRYEDAGKHGYYGDEVAA